MIAAHAVSERSGGGPRVLIVGGGAVGSIYAARLARVAKITGRFTHALVAVKGPHTGAAMSGIRGEVLADPLGAIWGKLIFNAAVNPLPVLTGLRLSEIYAHPETYALLRTLVEEGKAVAAALGITLPADPMAVIDAHRALGDAHTHVGSMKQDIDRGRPTEIDTLSGAVIAEGDRLGIPVPGSRTVYRLVKAVEARVTDAAQGR
jgi:2-dehydropantoate 2-reductase